MRPLILHHGQATLLGDTRPGGVVVARPLPPRAAAIVDRVAADTDDWSASILRTAIRDLAATGRPWTTDDLDREVLDVRPAQIGAAVRAAATGGLIRPTGEARPSTRPEAHGRLVRVWIGVQK